MNQITFLKDMLALDHFGGTELPLQSAELERFLQPLGIELLSWIVIESLKLFQCARIVCLDNGLLHFCVAEALTCQFIDLSYSKIVHSLFWIVLHCLSRNLTFHSST